jgi:hypothetical protein
MSSIDQGSEWKQILGLDLCARLRGLNVSIQTFVESYQAPLGRRLFQQTQMDLWPFDPKVSKQARHEKATETFDPKVRQLLQIFSKEISPVNRMRYCRFTTFGYHREHSRMCSAVAISDYRF